MNTELHALNFWFRAKRLSLNVDKTNYMLFTLNELKRSENIYINIGDSEIKRVNCVKFLGLYFDDCLKWDNHILNISNKIRKSIGVIRKVRNLLLPPDTYYTVLFTNISLSDILPPCVG
jgi:hypothetical protein